MYDDISDDEYVEAEETIGSVPEPRIQISKQVNSNQKHKEKNHTRRSSSGF